MINAINWAVKISLILNSWTNHQLFARRVSLIFEHIIKNYSITEENCSPKGVLLAATAIPFLKIKAKFVSMFIFAHTCIQIWASVRNTYCWLMLLNQPTSPSSSSWFTLNIGAPKKLKNKTAVNMVEEHMQIFTINTWHKAIKKKQQQ